MFLSFQKFPVGGNLNVQSQLHIHQLLVLADLQGHVLLRSLESFLQLSDAEFCILHCQLTTLLSLCYLSLQIVSLVEEAEKRIPLRLDFLNCCT